MEMQNKQKIKKEIGKERKERVQSHKCDLLIFALLVPNECYDNYLFASKTTKRSEISLLFAFEAFHCLHLRKTNIEMKLPFNFRLP